MTPDGPTFERNLEQLLTRAYVPVRARPRFEEELRADFLAAFERSRERWRLQHTALSRPALAWIAPAVAAAAALMVWWLLAPAEGPAPPLDPVARAEHRFDADEDFRARTDEVRFEAWPAYYELRTADGSAAVALAAGSVELGPDSQLAARVTAGSEAELLAGAATLAKPDDGDAWTLVTREGNLLFEQGELSLRLADDLEVFLAGRAALLTPDGPIGLPAGASRIAAGSLLGPAIALSAPDDDRRPVDGATLVESAPEPELPVETVAARTLRGRVVDDSGRPQRTFRVHLLLEQDYSNVTDPASRSFETADGFWTWEDAPEGRHHVYVEAEGFAVWRAPDLVDTRGEFVEVPDARLLRGVPVRGRVFDRATGRPIEGAAVVSEGDLPVPAIPLEPEELMAANLIGVTLTDVNGAFELSHMSLGKQILRATAEGFGPRWSQILEITPDSTHEVTFELEPGAAVDGHVYRDDGSPWPNVQLVATTVDMGGRDGRQEHISFAYAQTDRNGFYEFRDLPKSMMVVVLLGDDYAGGFPPQVQPANLSGRERMSIDFGSAATGTRVYGRLLDEEGNPLPRVPLSILHENVDPRGGSEGWVGGASDDEGNYSFAKVLPGKNQFCITSDMGESVTVVQVVDVPDWAEFETDVRLGLGRITGLVRGTDDRPVFYAAVIAERLDEEGEVTHFAAKAMTNLDGSFSVRYLSAGSYRVTVYPTTGEVPRTISPVEVVEGEEGVRVDVELESGAILELVVVDEFDRPVAEAHVVLIDPATGRREEPYFSTTDAEGKLRLYPGPAGPLKVEITKSGFSPTSAEWNLSVGTQTRRVVLGP